MGREQTKPKTRNSGEDANTVYTGRRRYCKDKPNISPIAIQMGRPTCHRTIKIGHTIKTKMVKTKLKMHITLRAKVIGCNSSTKCNTIGSALSVININT